MLTERPAGMTKQERCTFFCALLAGLAAHLYQYTNKLYNYDDLFTNPGGYGTGIDYGRWFLQIMGEGMNRFLGNYSLPLFNGLVTLLLLTVAAVLITRMYQIEDMILAGFIGIFFVTIPSVVCMNFFMFTVAYYAIGLFLSILSGYLMVRYGKKIWIQVVAVMMLACAVGTYQAYVTNTICILVLSVILSAAFSGEETRALDIVKMSVRYVISLVCGMISYFVCLKIFLSYWDVELGGYQGIDNMGKINLSDLPEMLYTCYYSFLWFCKNDILWENPTSIVKKCIFIMYLVSAVLTLYFIISRRKEKGKLVLLLLSLAAYPVAVFFIYIMVPDGWIYPLMTFSVVFIYVFILVWLDRAMKCTASQWTRLAAWLMHWGVSLAAIAIAVVYIWNANGNYMLMQYTQYYDRAYFQTLVTQIKSADGYRNDLPLAVIGDEFEDSAVIANSMYEAEFDLPGKMESNINAYSRWHIMIQYVGYNPVFLFDDETSKIAEWPEVKEMPCYPEDGSIQIINDVIVLKLSETLEE
jgi:hypothetical protein